ncbi:helix-turn-helix domain-containing protein [Streptomyces vinaceus]|uniref:helix-turn-helix domain-containing protein n=1 Tax=Streptomyces vinaceus TaxID=1960 RepID=UPI003679D1D3
MRRGRRGRVLSADVWAEVRRLRAAGTPIKQIARSMGLAPNTVRRLARSAEPPRYQRPARTSLAEPFEARILRLLEKEPALNAAEIARRIEWSASSSLLRSHVARLRLLVPAKPKHQQFLAVPYERPGPGWAECGLWWPPCELAVGHGQTRCCPVLVMVAGASGRLAARLLPSVRFRDVWIGHHQILQDWHAVPHTVAWDVQGIDDPWFWTAPGWDPSWATYVARAELSEITVEARGSGSRLTAARRRLRQAGLVNGDPLQPERFLLSLNSWVTTANDTGAQQSRWSSERDAMITLENARDLVGVAAARGRARPDVDCTIQVAGNHYLIGSWGARRRLTVDVTDTTVRISSSGYHAGGFHVLTYDRSWARGVRLTVPRSHVVTQGQRTYEAEGP